MADTRNPFADKPVQARERLGSTRDAALGQRILFYFSLLIFSAVVGLALAYVRPLLVFGGLLGIAATIVILRRPWLGLLLYTAIFLIRPGELYPVLARLRLEMLIGAITLFSLAHQQYVREGRLLFDRSRQSMLLIAFVCCAILSVPLSYWRSNAVDGVLTLFKILAFYVMVVQLVETRARLKVFVWIFLALTLYVIGSALVAYMSGGSVHAQGIDRATGTTSAGGGANALGETIAATFPVIFLLAAYKPLGWRRPLLAAGCVILLYTLIVTGSRGSLLGFIAGLGCIWWMSRHRMLGAVIGLVFLVVGFLALPDQYKERYSSITSRSLDESSTGRVEIWKDGLQMIAARPILGVGINCFMAAHYERDGWGMDAHSMYIEVAAEVGLVGAVIFFGFILEMLLANRRLARMLAQNPQWAFERSLVNGLFVGLVALCVTAAFGTQYIRRIWYVYGAVQLVILRCYIQEAGARRDFDPQSLSRDQAPNNVAAYTMGDSRI